jgi:hypothetical protein
MPNTTFWVAQDDGTFITQDDGTQIVLQEAPDIPPIEVRGGPPGYSARRGIHRRPPKPL